MKPITTLAILRKALQMKQRDFASDVAQCAEITIKMAERGKIPLSDALAARIAAQTNVPVEYLFCSVHTPLLNRQGMPYTLDDYQKHQARLARHEHDASDPILVQLALSRSTAIAAATLLRAYQEGKFELYAWKLKSAMAGVFSELTGDGIDRNGIVGQVLKCRRIKPYNTRPDLQPILDAWETGFKRTKRLKKS